MSKLRSQVVQLMLPWWGQHDGELYFQPMTLTAEGAVDRRVAFRIMRKWYKKNIGRSIRKDKLRVVWSTRFTTLAMTEDNVREYLHSLARDSYEQIKEDPNTGVQEEASKGSGE